MTSDTARRMRVLVSIAVRDTVGHEPECRPATDLGLVGAMAAETLV
jgi:hypothetical protein